MAAPATSRCKTLHLLLPGAVLPAWLCLLYTLLYPVVTIAQTQPATRVSVHLHQVSLDKLIQELRRQVDFQFIYSNTTQPPPGNISIDLDQVSLFTLLDKALEKTGWEYHLEKKLIIIRPAATPPTTADSSNAVPLPVIALSGTVTDPDGTPLPFVSITLPKRHKGTFTNEQGAYSLQGAPGDLLAITCVGYESRHLRITTGMPTNISLNKNRQTIPEVIVTGYQQLKSQEMTGAVYTTTGAALRTPGINRIDQAIQGRIPGASVQFSSGGVGTAPKIRIRGTTTLLGDREPLWVIDGVVRESPFPHKTGTETDMLSVADRAAMQAGLSVFGNGITGLNPDDIADITVLKDAAATAIYGTRAGNGVIVITTHSGKSGPLRIQVRNDITVTDKPSYRHMNRMNATERIALSRELFDKGIVYPDDILPPTGYEAYLLQLLHKNISQADFNREVTRLENNNTNWFNVLFRNAVSNNTHVSLQGGDKYLHWYASLGHTAENGNAIRNDMRRLTTAFQATVKPWSFLEARINLQTATYRIHGFYDGLNPYEYAWNTNRVISPDEFYYASMGTAYKPAEFTFGKQPLRFNFLHELNHTGNVSNSNSVNSSILIKAKITRWLRWESLYAFGYDATINRRHADAQAFATALLRGANYEAVPGSDTPVADYLIRQVDSVRKKSSTWRNTLYFHFPAGGGRHDIDIMAGTEMRTNLYEGLSYNAKKAITDSILSNNVNSVFNFLSFYGSIAYAYRRKYMVSVHARTDASNRFATGSPYRLNPVWSAGLRWNMSQEPWLRTQHWLSQLAWKFSFGYQGNTVESISPHLVATNVNPSFDPYTGQYYLGIKNLPYTDLRWERTRSINAGVDMGFFSNRFRVQLDYYQKITADVILKQQVPEEYGLPDSFVNGGEIYNRGWELLVNWVPVQRKNITWEWQLILARNDNEVRNTRSDARVVSLVNGNAIVNGKPVGGLWSFPYAGLSPRDGQPLFRYLDVDIDRERLLHGKPTSYLVYSGNTEPVFSGGINTQLQYGRWSLAGSFTAQLGYIIRLNPLMQGASAGYARPPAPDRNVDRQLADRWQHPGDEKWTTVPSIYSFQYYPFVYSVGKYFGDLSLSKDGTNLYPYDLYNYSDQITVNGSHLRCNYITVGYELVPKNTSWFKSIRSARLSVSVNNPFLIADKRLKGQDPEIQRMSVTENTTALPRYRSYVMSINVQL
nr:SusC/RagA family TonB-linked outer membrane protein [Chitinophaga nivalis]